jgi:epoxyqueuosine reductase
MSDLKSSLIERAHSLGFSLVGVARASEADGFDRLREWLERGYAGEMTYLHRHADARQHPSSILPEVQSVIMLGLNYANTDVAPSPNSGRVARYAQGPDYHDVLRAKLNELLDWVRDEVPGCVGRGIVDTAPLLERDFARRAGLGWFGKNTMLLNRRQGSYLFLAALLLNLELEADAPHETSHCGTCTACLDACPTDAFRGPGWLDARRCISYLTIELRSSVPEEWREGIGDWLFGCDVCQEVCPWNRRRPLEGTVTLAHRDDLESLDAIELLGLDEPAFRERFRGTAFLRAKRRGLLRNAALVLGNVGDERALPALRRAAEDPEPLIAEAARWAIERIETTMSGSA